jgi:hypothetical protein
MILLSVLLPTSITADDRQRRFLRGTFESETCESRWPLIYALIKKFQSRSTRQPRMAAGIPESLKDNCIQIGTAQ